MSRLLHDLIEKMKRPGVLGLAGMAIERRCTKDLRGYFDHLATVVLPLKLEDLVAGSPDDAMVLHSVAMKLHNVLRKERELLLGILTVNKKKAYEVASKQQVIHEAEVELKEWPDKSGVDDHGRGGTHTDLWIQHHDYGTKSAKSVGPAEWRPGMDSTHADLQRSQMARVPYDEVQRGWASVDTNAKSVVISPHAHSADQKITKNTISHFKAKYKGFSVSTSTSFHEADVRDKLGPSGEEASAYAADNAAQQVVGIDKTTERLLANAISKGIKDQLGPDGTARLLKGAMEDMSSARARVIASTEVNDAMSQAALSKMKKLGVQYKQLIPSIGACPICLSIVAQGPIPVDEPFVGIDGEENDASPIHPNCRCATTGARAPQGDN